MESSAAAPLPVTEEEESQGRFAQLQGYLHVGWFLLLVRIRRPGSFVQYNLLFVYAYVLAFITKWAIAWGLLLWLAPTSWLPGDAAMSTIAQVLPALMVSVFVFILGSFFVVTQLATTIHSNRASLLLLRDLRVQQAVARPLVISLFTLLLVLFSPTSVDPAVASLALILVAATAFTLVSAATLLPYLITRVTAPRNFALYVLDGVDMLLAMGNTGDVVYRVGALGEMLKRGVRQGDMLQLQQAIFGLDAFHDVYLAIAEENPSIRTHHYENGSTTGWLGQELAAVLVSAAQEALTEDIDNQECNRMATSLRRFAARSAEAGHLEEFRHAVEGLTMMAVCTQQMRAPGLVNAYTEPVYGLAVLVRDAARDLGSEAAAEPLASWSLTMAYAIHHLGASIDGAPGHTHWTLSLEAFPEDTPWDEAHDLLDSDAFQRRWGNQLGAIPPLFGPPPPDEDADTDDGDVEPVMLVPPGLAAVHLWLELGQANWDELGQSPPGP